MVHIIYVCAYIHITRQAGAQCHGTYRVLPGNVHLDLTCLEDAYEMETMALKTSAFESLRPFCVQLTVEQTVQNVQNLRKQISCTDMLALQDLLDYVLFPLRFSLKTPGPKKPGLVQVVMECISYLLSLTHVKTAVSLKEMFDEVCSCLPPDLSHPVPEELKLAVVLAMQSLLRSSGENVLPVLYKPAVLPEMGYAISLLLRLAELEKSREIRLEALNCLERLLFPEVKLSHSLGDLFASFLPGVCTVLTRIICGDPKQGYRLTTAAIKLWAGIVSLVMSDESLAQVPEKKPYYPGLSVRVAELLVHRENSWVKSSASRLVIHLGKIAERCSADPHWKVRMALVDLAHVLIRSCWNSVGDAAGSLLQILVGHMNDDRPEVKEKSRKALLEIGKDGPASRTLGEVLSESLHSLAVTLPRLLSCQDDKGKLHTLALLLGYLQLLGPRLTFTLHSSAHLQRLSSALLQTLELDLCSVKVVEERLPSSSVANLTQENIEHTGPQQKNFRFFRDPRILSYLQHVCRLLGYYGDFYLLTDHFLGLYRAQRLPALIVLNQLVLGAAGIEVEKLHGGNKILEAVELLEAVRPLLEEYTDPANWHLYTCQSSQEVVDQMALLHVGQKPNSAISDLSANAWKLCLQLEGISCIAQALGTNFRQLLICALYPLLEKAGDPNLLVSGTALVTLADVSQACGYKDIKQLVALNADYLESEVSVGLRRLQRHGSAARVFHAMLDNCCPSLLPLLHELVQDLLPALDHSQNDGAKLLFPVLNSLVTRLGKWFPPAESTEKPPLTCRSNESRVHCGNMAHDIKEFLQGHIQQYQLARGEMKEDDVADVVVPLEEAKEEEKPALATHVKISKEVAEKCTHFLSHSDPQIRVQALDTLRLSLLLIPQEDVLLPLAHKIWPCLVKRLLQDEPLVLFRAFQVLVSLASSCKEFLRQRVCKDALPAFLMYLRSQALVSCHTGPVYSRTLGFKLQTAVLEGLGTLCVDLALGDSDLLEVIDSCMLYLSARQPKKLQEAAIRTFLYLSQLDPDIVWLYLCEWQSPPETPHPSLVSLPWKGKPQDEFTPNVHLLLQKLQ